MFDPRVKPERGTYELDRDHPLAQGLARCYLFNERAGKLVCDLVTGISSPLIGGVTWQSNFPDATFPSATFDGLRFDGTTGYIPVSTNSLIGKLTYASIAAQVTSDSAGNRQIYCERSSNTPIFKLQYTGRTSLQTRDDSGVLNTTSATYQYIHNGGHHIATTKSGAGINFYNDGLPGGSGTLTGTDVRTVSDCRIGMDGFTGGEFFSGGLGYMYVYRRALMPNEATWLAAEPYAMLRPLQRQTWFIPSGSTLFRNRAGSRGRLLLAA